jgi:phenylalanyl-tRNA synthetase alpha chain
VLENQIAQLESATLARIHAAKNLDELETIRVDVLGRKGSLAQFSKEFGKLTPEERSSAGKSLNAAKQSLESAFDERKQAFDIEALDQRLQAEWIDLTLPAPGPRPSSLHPLTLVQREMYLKLKPNTTISMLSIFQRSIPRATCRIRFG